MVSKYLENQRIKKIKETFSKKHAIVKKPVKARL